MTRLLDAELKFIITSPSQKFTLFMMPDAVFKAAGYDYNSTSNDLELYATRRYSYFR